MFVMLTQTFVNVVIVCLRGIQRFQGRRKNTVNGTTAVSVGLSSAAPVRCDAMLFHG